MKSHRIAQLNNSFEFVLAQSKLKFMCDSSKFLYCRSGLSLWLLTLTWGPFLTYLSNNTLCLSIANHAAIFAGLYCCVPNLQKHTGIVQTPPHTAFSIAGRVMATCSKMCITDIYYSRHVSLSRRSKTRTPSFQFLFTHVNAHIAGVIVVGFCCWRRTRCCGYRCLC
jgi:hypothetical protein